MGKYRGVAHYKCNLQFKKPKFTPVILHNLAGYDFYLFVKNLGKTEGKIKCIPNNEKSYISFSKDILVASSHDKEDEFKEFRKVCFENDDLYPAWYYTAPVLARDAALKQTPRSAYKPSESSDDSDNETLRSDSIKDKLNEFLSIRDISPIRSKPKTTWHLTKERTKRHYVRRARQAVPGVIEEIVPEDTRSLWEALLSSKACGFPLDTKDHADVTLIEALTGYYNNAGPWITRRKILSILADIISFKWLKKWIPDLTCYRFDIARDHQLLHGRGALVSTTQYTRTYIAPGQLSHFINFITSTHIIQDLPFSEKKLKLSSNEELTIPNVIRSVIPAQIVSQYEELCRSCTMSDFLSNVIEITVQNLEKL
ncbi:hypothetical protein AWC38_SpisGene9007 [Stylophora pistillata]|uniref:DNA-directed DNA polymerase n=1 Tax=Stylophora pistillata TaxID=50429 RepID=A0A2B4S6J4_STYPI|nr:hypothetical protein AWC38_SpisGene9007 [Stylophora pistillata]